jgi:fatty-acyl-CoA synthase
LIQNEIGLQKADIDIIDGGALRMRVTVSVDEVDQLSVPDIEQALAAYLFETRVKVI